MPSENISTPIYAKCDKTYRSKVCVPHFRYFVPGLDNQLEQSKNDSPVCKKIGCWWGNTTSHILFFLTGMEVLKVYIYKENVLCKTCKQKESWGYWPM